MSEYFRQEGVRVIRNPSIAVLGGLLLAVAAHTLSAQPYFMGIGTLNGSAVSPWDVSPEALVVSGDTGIFGSQVVLWTMEDGLRSITPKQTADTSGGISHLGRIVLGGFPGNGTRHAFRWTEETGAVSIGDLPGGEFGSAAGSVSACGDIIVGGSWSDNGREAFHWTEETGMIPLGDLSGGIFRSNARAISADRLVIVGTGRSEQGSEAYRWTAETGMVGLGDLDGGTFASSATAVSADGSVIAGTGNSGGPWAFRWTEETGMVRLDFPDPPYSQYRVYGMSWDGDTIVGEAVYIDRQSGAFYWTAREGFRMLDDVLTEHGIEGHHGWHLSRASAVSADGRTIVGSGINPDGSGGGWVTYLGPGCRADFDDNGTVDAEDVAAYITAWLNRSIFTDWDYDGSINTRDLLGFLNEWVAKPGCE